MRRRPFRVSWLFVAAALVAVLAPRSARAQRGVDVALFRPALDSYGLFTVERAEISSPSDFGVKLYGNFASNPLRLTMSDTTDPTHARAQSSVLMSRQIVLDLGMQLGLASWLEIVADFPVSAQSYTAAYGSGGSFADPSLVHSGFYAADRSTNIAPPDAAPLDARVGFKLRFHSAHGFGLGATAIVTLPFGDDSSFLGDTGFTFQPKIIADFTHTAFTAAINVGAIVRQETRIYDPYDQAAALAHPRLLLDVGDELTWSAGVAYRFVRWFGIGAEVFGLAPVVGVRKDFTADALGGLQLFPTNDLIVSIGAGAGLFRTAGRRDDFRVFVGIAWAPQKLGRNVTAAGGIDSDGDGIPDVQDLCPNEPEDRDGFDDEDGCPDLDNDQDGIPDTLDRCPNEPEDRDGFRDEDGCPDTDNDGDGIPDAQDKCPNEPEDRDGFQDDDGCPDVDNDGDGIPDAMDKCPNEPETRNGVDDEDGCPDTGGAVVVTPTGIALPEQLQFELGRATLAPRSEALLKRLADKINANAHIKRLRIEGHTDDIGTEKKNQELSQARAEAVREFLIARGVAAERLQAVGYGNTRPLARRTTSDARAKNRRVELIIVEQ